MLWLPVTSSRLQGFLFCIPR